MLEKKFKKIISLLLKTWRFLTTLHVITTEHSQLPFKTINGATVERYTGCSLDPNSTNYVAKRIGDQYLEWDATDKRYRTYGDYQNQSDLFYIEMDDSVNTEGILPMGFRGPVRPKGFGLLVGETSPKTLDLSADFAGAAVKIWR